MSEEKLDRIARQLVKNDLLLLELWLAIGKACELAGEDPSALTDADKSGILARVGAETSRMGPGWCEPNV